MSCRMPKLMVLGVGALAVSAWLTQCATAQVTSLGGSSAGSTGSTSSGMFGSRTVGGSSGLTAGSRSFTSGSSSGGRQTLGQGQQLGGGQGVLNRTLMNDTSGGIQNNARFLRQNRGGQFVGSDAADISGALGTLGGGQSGVNGLNNLTQQLRGNNNRQRNNQPNQRTGQNGAAQQLSFRISRKTSFEPPVQPTGAATALSARLTQMVQRSSLVQAESPLQVVVRGRIATLRGSVASDHARDLAARLVLLEPGVDQVDNQLQVVEASEDE
jgi:osmotically-inducible protein OsmY